VHKILEELYFFLPAIIALGIITSYEDLKCGKIRNKYILAALIYAFIVNLGLIIFFKIKTDIINYPYISEYLISITLALILGFYLWYGKFWTSGDAKLYLAFSALMPLSAYGFGYIKYAPNLTILINTFIPLAIFYFFKILFGTSWNDKKQVLKKIFDIKPFLKYLLFIFAILWLPIILMSLGIILSFIEIMAITMLISFFLKKLPEKNMSAIFIIITITRLILDKTVYSIFFLRQFFIFLFIFVILQTFFNELGKFTFSEKRKIKDLKNGMILSENICKDGNKYIKETNVMPIKKIAYFFRQNGNGLTCEDVQKLKKLKIEKKLKFSDIRVNKITPFAHYMFMGVLITIIFNGNFIGTLSNMDYFLIGILPKLGGIIILIAISALITIGLYYHINNKKGYK